MSDERVNSDKCNASSVSPKNIIKNKNNETENERIIAEAAKIFLKNGLNGANAAAAAAAVAAAATATLLTTSPFQLPTTPLHSQQQQQQQQQHHQLNLFEPNSQLLQSEKLTETAASTAAGGNRTKCSVVSVNNGLSSLSTNIKSNKMAATAASPSAQIGEANVKAETGVDYSISTNLASLSSCPTTPSSLSTIANNNHNHNKYQNSNILHDVSRNAISATTAISVTGPLQAGSAYGGRLQFFKDGKFILELARSKDGERGGWVSVPRKLFRSPSATSSTVTPSSANSIAFLKNESSASLSFSDDNSSIQSSPWQRDHSWKQSAPRHGISKEMTFLYCRPRGIILKSNAWQAAQKKRRKPYDITSISEKIFRSLENLVSKNDKNLSQSEDKEHHTAMDSETSDLIEREQSIHSLKNGSTEEDGCSLSSSSTATLVGNESISNIDVTSPMTPTKGNRSDPNRTAKKDDEENECSQRDKMNTSEDESINTSSVECDKPAINGKTDEKMHSQFNNSETNLKIKTDNTDKSKKSIIEKGGETKRLKKLPTRAKLLTIIQKLIDEMPTRYMSKTQPSSGTSGEVVNNHCNSTTTHKVSPQSSSSATSRLVEYHHQHVSPRKRILREFEKVSLEDNSAIVNAKRSRPKSNTNASMAITTSQFQNDKVTPNRLSHNASMNSGTISGTVDSKHNDILRFGSTTSISQTTSKSNMTPSTPATPTRLYSSYSINSLLAGSSPSSSSKKANDQAIVSSIGYQQHQHQPYHHGPSSHHTYTTDPLYLRSMLSSPKSPEGNSNSSCGGKSPSHAVNKKRSPPYASPLRDTHSRSPTVSHSVTNDYGRRSPRATPPESGFGSYKMRYGSGVEHSGIPPPSTVSHSSSNNYQQHHSSYYSPYMSSPKYMPAPNTNSISPNSIVAGTTTTTARHSSAFSSTSSLATSTNIPNSSQRELSPTRSSTASPRESTPRTVPKKTVSIRRQFASPSTGTDNICPSPSEQRTFDESVACHQDRKTPIAQSSAQQHHLLAARNSPASNINPMGPTLNPFFMYPPSSSGITGASSPLSHSSPSAMVAHSNSSAAAAAAAAVAAAAAAYMPSVIPTPYYHPYIPTLASLRHNSVWMHYAGAGAPVLASHHHPVSSPSARLSPPYHGFPFNGVGAAAVAAAAAAAAFTGSPAGFPPPPPPPGPHHHHHHHMPTPTTATAHLRSGLTTGGTSSINRSISPKLTDNNADHSTLTKHSASSNSLKSNVSTTPMSGNIKDEHSSDLPLNLSKH